MSTVGGRGGGGFPGCMTVNVLRHSFIGEATKETVISKQRSSNLILIYLCQMFGTENGSKTFYDTGVHFKMCR